LGILHVFAPLASNKPAVKLLHVDEFDDAWPVIGRLGIYSEARLVTENAQVDDQKDENANEADKLKDF
jgi:hypothetical protein